MELLSTLQTYEEKAIKDPLTGVFNHGEVETQLNNAIALRQKSETPVSVMMLDLDKFKAVNDNYGHATGDLTLKNFAKILMDMAAEEKALAGRRGGEEFVIICREKNADEACKMAEKLRQKVEEYLFPEICHITCSVGVTELKAADSFKDVFDRMDKAMYASKHNGRNMVTLM